VHLLIDDLFQLLSTGKMKRTFGGVEYAIPLSPSTGMGDLKKNLIIDDGRAKVEFCPGLIAAMLTLGVIPAELPIEQQAEKLQSILRNYTTSKSRLTVEELIRQVLMEKHSLTENDLKTFHSLEMNLLKSSKGAFGGVDLGVSRQLERIRNFNAKEKEARSAFKGICDNALLKAWEYTLASFSEVKMEFSRWNLYSSLGLAPEEPGGIGQLIYQIIDEKIKALNSKIEEFQKQYEIAFDQVRATEALLRNASSESDARRLSAEYQSRAYHMRSCLEMRDKIYEKGSNYSKLFSFLTKHYDQRFPEYFQEIYDPEMQDFQGESYDDSPAGFRLVYKHGRPDPSLWTLIYSADQYIDCLLDFFSVTEAAIAADCDWDGGSAEILELTSAIVAHVRSQQFLESALQRMAKAHQVSVLQSSLKNMQVLEKKPWAYTSGGTITTLMKTYFCRESEFSHEEKWVESETELLIFILDALKNLPHKISDPFLKNPQKKMLMSSPSHVFLLMPGQKGLEQGWQEEIFTYTWVRDQVFLPSQSFYAGMHLKADEQQFLLNEFLEQLPPLIGHYLHQASFSFDKKSSVIDWRNRVLEVLFQHMHADTAQKQKLAARLDGFLYQALPLFKGREWKVIVRRILSDLMDEKVNQVLQDFPDDSSAFITAKQVKEIAKGCYLLSQKSLILPFDLHQYVADHSRFVGNAQPTPLLFADTNWTNNYFSFLVNPGNGRLELWRVDRTMSQGLPMYEWKQWLNGTDRKNWSIFNRPYEHEMPALRNAF
jgi:hypothetical protein